MKSGMNTESNRSAMINIVMIFYVFSWLFVIPLTFTTTPQAVALHGHWIDHYQSATGMSCCGVRDCVKTPLRLLDMTPDTVTVELPQLRKVITIPRQSYHASEDTHDYWCAVKQDQLPSTDNTRCVFLAVGG